MKDDGLYLEHIVDSITLIGEWTRAGRTSLDDLRTRDAVLHRLQTLAQSANRTSDALKGAHPEVPWREMMDFRNVIVHEYLSVDYDRVWRIIETRLAPLQRQVERILTTLT